MDNGAAKLILVPRTSRQLMSGIDIEPGVDAEEPVTQFSGTLFGSEEWGGCLHRATIVYCSRQKRYEGLSPSDRNFGGAAQYCILANITKNNDVNSTDIEGFYGNEMQWDFCW